MKTMNRLCVVAALVIAFIITTVPALAQPPAAHHHKVIGEITFLSDVKLGTHLLRAGTYRIECDHVLIDFIDASTGDVLELPCEGREMERVALVTEAVLALDSEGNHYVERLYLKGSPIEHVFLR